MDSKRIAIYPFSEECMIFSKHTELIGNGYIFAEAAAPAIWETSGRKIRTSEGEYIIKKSPSDFEGDVDILLIPEFECAENGERGLISAITKYLPKVSKVMYYGKFTDASRNKLIEKCAECGCEFDDRRNIRRGITCDILDEDLHKHDVPIVAVAGLWENTGKEDILLSLKEKFINEGYKVTVIGARGYSDLFDCRIFPDFMLADDVAEKSKPIMFNRYIDQLIYDDDPDIILLGIPGSIQVLTDKYTNGFGITPFVAFQSFVADFMILCSFYDNLGAEFYEEISKMCKYRYGIVPDIYHMSDMYIDISESDENGTATAHIAFKENVAEAVEELQGVSKTPVLDLTDAKNVDLVYRMIIAKLTGDTRVVV